MEKFLSFKLTIYYFRCSAVLVVVSCIGAYFCSYWLPENEEDDVSATISDILYWPILVSFCFFACILCCFLCCFFLSVFCAPWVNFYWFTTGIWYLQVISLLVMGSISIADSIANSFYSNYMLNRFGLSETKSGGMLTIASIIYTITTFISGCIGSRQKVSLVKLCYFPVYNTKSESLLINYRIIYITVLTSVKLNFNII